MLIVFDVDGTLTRTVETDAALFARAFAETHGIVIDEAEWRSCRCISDRGIAEEVLARRQGRVQRAAVTALRQRFLTLLDAALPADPAALAVPGAAAIAGWLAAEGHAVAIATGCWGASARLKLARAGIAVDGMAFASCDDDPAREAIVELAIARAGGRGRHGRVVSVGDGAWDVAAARALGLPFVGVDHARTGRLAGLGASAVVTDFADPARFLAALAAAPTPP